MKRPFLVVLSAIIGLVLFYQIAAVLSYSSSKTVTTTYDYAEMNIIDLGTLGGDTSAAGDLNESGMVIGSSVLSPDVGSQAFLWTNDTMQHLEVPQGYASLAAAINDDGLIAGSQISGTDEMSEQWPAIWDGDVFIPLPTEDDQMAGASAVNNAGIVAGQTISETNNQIQLWQDGELSQTIPVEDGVAFVNGINMENVLVGRIHDGAGDNAFLWEDGTFTDLGTLGGQNGEATAVNDLKQIVGSAAISENLGTHAFLWDGGEMIDLGTLGGVISETSKALDINNLGAIVGEAQFEDTRHAVLWQDGEILDLNSFLAQDSGWDVLLSAAAINDQGWIAGTGLIDGSEHAFLITPRPAPGEVYLPVIAGSAAGPLPTTTPTPTTTPGPSPTPSPSPTAPSTGYDLTRYIYGDDRIFEVFFKAPDFETQARHQTQRASGRVYQTKGNEFSAEWEEFWNNTAYIYRGTDTSPGVINGALAYYTLYESRDDFLAGNEGSRWSHRFMNVGDRFFRRPYVVFFRKADCALHIGGYTDPSWLIFVAYHNNYTFPTGITVKNVVELAWVPGGAIGPTDPIDERYFYAENYGLVGWVKPSESKYSAIVEEHGPGERPNNKREQINCLNQAQYAPQAINSELLLDGPLPEPYASLVRP